MGDVYVAIPQPSAATMAACVEPARHQGRRPSRHAVVKFGSESATGVGLHDGYLYVAQNTSIIRYKMTPGTHGANR